MTGVFVTGYAEWSSKSTPLSFSSLIVPASEHLLQPDLLA